MGILEFFLLIIFIAWIGGFALNLGGDLVHLLLVILALGLIYRVYTGRNL